MIQSFETCTPQSSEISSKRLRLLRQSAAAAAMCLSSAALNEYFKMHTISIHTAFVRSMQYELHSHGTLAPLRPVLMPCLLKSSLMSSSTSFRLFVSILLKGSERMRMRR